MSVFWNRARDFLLGAPVPKDSPGIHSEWVQLAEWSDTQQLLVMLLVLAVLILSAWNLRKVPLWRYKIALLALRLGVISILLFAFYQPALLEERRARSTNTVVILADDSISMALPQGQGTRRDQVAAFVSDHSDFWKHIEDQNVIEAYRFSDTVEASDWRELGKRLTARGQHTPILETFEQLRDRYRNRDVGGIILLSDGIDNGRANRVMGGSGQLDEESLRLLKSFEAPIYTFGLDAAQIRDISVHELRYSPFAFKRNLSTIEADIEVSGYREGMLEIELLEEGRLVRSVTRPIVPNQRLVTVAFDFTPLELGHRVYAIRVKPLDGEVTVENNERYAVIRINRDKIRVLQIAGHPSWDERFLRNHLKRRPNIQLISFFILINPSGSFRPINPQDTALIPFPAEELFVDELGSFDLVILQDFNYGPFATPQHLPRIRDYVRSGGALLMLGGRLALGAGDYAGTELEEVLPITMAEPSPTDNALDTAAFRPRLTDASQSHAVTRLSFDQTENRQRWAKLPKLEGLNKTWALKPGASVLLEHPDLAMKNGKPMPVLVLGEPQKGRTAVFATDTLWRYKMPAVGLGLSGRDYDTLLNNLTRWLVKDPDLDLIRVTPSSGVRALGEPVDLEVRVFSPDYKPAADLAFALRVTRRPREVGASPEVVFESTGLRSDTAGRHGLTRTETKAGIYDVRVRATIASRQIDAHTVYVVTDERPELREVVGNTRLLEAIAEATGGTYHSLEARNVPLTFKPPRVSDVTSRRYHERWNVPGVFALACLLFALEWWARRRVGLL